CGIAVSMFQDAVEMMIWALVKKYNLQVKDQSSFTSNLDQLRVAGISVAETARILELNKARVGFKHYGNLPAPTDATKFQASTEVFLRVVSLEHFKLEFDSYSLVDVVPFQEVRSYLKAAETFVEKKSYKEAVGEISIAKAILFSMLGNYVPEVDRNLSRFDQYIENALKIPGEVNGSYITGHLNGFEYITYYLERIREATLISLLNLPFDDYYFLVSTLFRADRAASGQWHLVSLRNIDYTAEICNRQIKCVAEMAFQLREVLRDELPTDSSS
ncbi:MAG: hypothetical protein ACRDAM_18745, partial [Casimicrobium sp.]